MIGRWDLRKLRHDRIALEAEQSRHIGIAHQQLFRIVEPDVSDGRTRRIGDPRAGAALPLPKLTLLLGPGILRNIELERLAMKVGRTIEDLGHSNLDQSRHQKWPPSRRGSAIGPDVVVPI